MPSTIENNSVKIHDHSQLKPSNNDNNIQVYINNVACAFSTKSHLNLRRIALEGTHVEYKKENNMVHMRMRRPLTTATIWSSGKITCTGATSEQDAYTAARRYCRLLQKMKFKVRFSHFRVTNVLATCLLPFEVDIHSFSNGHQKECTYEPELHPWATFRIKEFKATLKLFNTGSITLTCPSVAACQNAINHIYPLVYKYRRDVATNKIHVDLNNNASFETNKNNVVATKQEKVLIQEKPIDVVKFVQHKTQEPTIKPEVTKLEEAVSTIRVDLPSYHSYQLFDDNILNSTYNYSINSFYENSSSTMYACDNSNSDHLFANNNSDTMMSTATTTGCLYASTTTHNLGSVFSGSQTSHWFNDNLLIDNLLDDFLP